MIGPISRDSYYSGPDPKVDVSLIAVTASDRVVRQWIATSAVGLWPDVLVAGYYDDSAPQDSRYSKLGAACGYDYELKYKGMKRVVIDWVLQWVHEFEKSSIRACIGDSGGPVFHMWSSRINGMRVNYALVIGTFVAWYEGVTKMFYMRRLFT